MLALGLSGSSAGSLEQGPIVKRTYLARVQLLGHPFAYTCIFVSLLAVLIDPKSIGLVNTLVIVP